ncbi:MAG: OsmC family protein [Pseudomonadota bacterium]
MPQTESKTSANIVNGLNVDDLMALIGSVKQDPENAKTSWSVTTSWQGQTRTKSEVNSFKLGDTEIERSFAFEIDEPLELGGSNAFANPQEHLLAALNACMTVGYVAQCAVRGLTIDRLEIETEGDIDLRGFLGIDPAISNGYESLTYTVRISGDGSKEEFSDVHDAVMATSPNFFNLSKSISLIPKLVVQ